MKNFFNPWLDASIKDKTLSRYYRGRVVDQAPITPQATDSYLTSALPRLRLQLFFWVVMIGCGLLLSRSFFLQIIQGDYWLALADRNRIHIEYLPAARGLVYDTNDRPLVYNEPNVVLSLIPAELPATTAADYAMVMGTIATTLQMDQTQLEQAVTVHAQQYVDQPLVVADFLPHDQALRLLSTLRHSPGVHIEAQASRHYLQPEAFAHVLGYLGKISPADLTSARAYDYSLADTIGKSGLELIYENSIRGQKGERQVEINAQGQAIDTIAETPAVPGSNLVLSIDATLQQLLYDALADVSQAKDSPGGAAVALDPRTGKIRALVSYPGFDNNLFIRGISTDAYSQLINDERKPLFNKAISGEYPSGSTFKLIVASAALQEGVVTDQTIVNSTGGIQLDKLYRDWKAGGHGSTTIYKALAESVNTYFYLAGGGSYNSTTREIQGGLGIDRMATYARAFGLSQTSGLDLPGEAAGFMPDRAWKETVKGENWYLGDTYIVSIGQGDVRVTPLQVAQYTAVVANGGTLYRPSVVDRMTRQTGETINSLEPEIIRQAFIDPTYLAVVRRGMRQAVLTGSARRMSSLPTTSAGKTGTAQIGGSDRTHSWYTTFLPYDDPELVLTVLVEEGGEGSESALTVAQTALTQYLAD